MKKRIISAAAFTAAALVLTGCAGGDTGGDAAPIKLGAVSTISGPATFPEASAAAQAVFDRVNAEGGIAPIISNTLYVTGLAMLITTPIAVLAAVYLTEYAQQGKLVDTIRFAADSLASVPSIVMGLFGFALFVEAMG